MASEHSLTGGPVSFGHFRAPGKAANSARHRADWYSLVAGVAIATATAVTATGPVRSWESTLFEAANGLPHNGIREAVDRPRGVVVGSTVNRIAGIFIPQRAEMEIGPDG